MLKSGGIENFNQEAEILTTFAFSIRKEDLYITPERIISSYGQNILKSIISKRLNKVPVQRIVGETNFRSHRICVEDASFIPRQETEGLVDFILPMVRKKCRIIDIGCGSGCIAISILKESEAELAVGIDILNSSVLISRLNSIINHVDDRFIAMHADFMRTGLKQIKDFIENKIQNLIIDRFDIAICNPPYISHDSIEGLQPEVRIFDPYIALNGGVDGLLFYRILALKISDYLKKGSYLFLELGDGQADDVVNIFSSFPQFHNFHVESDLHTVERYLYLACG